MGLEGMLRAGRRIAALALITAAGMAGVAQAASPPGPPATGPGSEASLPWTSTVRVDHTFANTALNYTTFEPAGWRGHGKEPASAPLVVFLHGYLGYDPKHYATWLDHIVRQGNVVVFPAYQSNALTPPRTFTDKALWSLKHALPWLASNARITPDTSQGMVLVGHSYGGPISANLAARAAAEGLPQPRSIFFALPWWQNIDPDLSTIPSTTKVLCVVGDHDTLAGRTGCDALWDKTEHIPTTHRNYVLMRSDAYGTPELDAWHRVPSDADDDGFNALDWYGMWKLSDALRTCALLDKDCRYAFGNTWEQTFMGRWSDGRLVNQLWVYATKPADPFPAVDLPGPQGSPPPCPGDDDRAPGQGNGAGPGDGDSGGPGCGNRPDVPLPPGHWPDRSSDGAGHTGGNSALSVASP